MTHQYEQRPARRAISILGVLSWLIVLTGTARCHQSAGPISVRSDTTLRVGVGGLPLQAPQAGLRQLVNNLSLEGLVNFNEDGRPRAFLAESWSTTPDGLTLTLQLHRKATFHDGSAVNATTIIPLLQEALPKVMGAAFDDIAEIRSIGETQLEFRLRRPAPLVIEALETTLQKPGKEGISVGPYVPTRSTSPLELKANVGYYLGPPAVSSLLVTPYPSVRAAWAELLRGSIDMLYEVNVDALDSLQSSSDVALFSFVRHYQYMIVFGSQAPIFKSPEVRRELNAVIDRATLVREGLNGHGVASAGPVPPRHWALSGDAPKLAFDATKAASLQNRHLRFTCLVPADSVYERIALAVKRQLAAASVDMQVREGTQEQLIEAMARNDFEAILVDSVSGPSMFRSYQRWHSGGPFPLKTRESPSIDSALDRVRHAASDDEYRSGVTAFQQAIVDDPPAIFLAWAERARAVSRRFDVPVPDDGRDVLATLRMWRPAGEKRVATRN
jgi:peptide/nickel transport system substrate-binding protein